MVALLFLDNGDFEIKPQQEGDALHTKLTGFSLILFYSTQCTHCKTLVPVFKQLPTAIGGCQFAMMNVSNNKETVLSSQKTITPIKYVPLVMLYIDGKPVSQHSGAHTIEAISEFVIEATKKFAGTKEDNIQAPPTLDDIPAYSIARPSNKKGNKCYLNCTDSYCSI
jgi:thioredoxin-like negative regulator of GroEL